MIRVLWAIKLQPRKSRMLSCFYVKALKILSQRFSPFGMHMPKTFIYLVIFIQHHLVMNEEAYKQDTIAIGTNMIMLINNKS